METFQKERSSRKRRPKKEQEWKDFLNTLRNTPEEKLSAIAKYWLKHENDSEEDKWIIYDMKAVMK